MGMAVVGCSSFCNMEDQPAIRQRHGDFECENAKMEKIKIPKGSDDLLSEGCGAACSSETSMRLDTVVG